MNRAPLLELFFFETCPYCIRVIDKINELAIDVQYKNIEEDADSLARLIKDTGRRTVPCLYIDNRPMHESRDIMNWLVENQSKLQKKRQ